MWTRESSIAKPNLDCCKELYRSRIPAIFHNNYYENLRYPRVLVNDTECADMLVGKLIQADHQHIAGIFIYDNYQSVFALRCKSKVCWLRFLW